MSRFTHILHLDSPTSCISIHRISFRSHVVTLEMSINRSHEIIIITYVSVYLVYSFIHFELLYLIFNRNSCFLLFVSCGSDLPYL